MADTSSIVIGLAGGVGGAFLTGCFSFVSAALADKRRYRTDLDAWLREKRYEQVTRFVRAFRAPLEHLEFTSEERSAWLAEIEDAAVSLRTVAPDAMQKMIDAALDDARATLPKIQSLSEIQLSLNEVGAHITDLERPVKALAWRGGYVHSYSTRVFGWDQNPLGLERKGFWQRVKRRSRQRARSNPPADRDS